MKYDIIIAYRFYPKISKKPFLRADDKLAMICGGLQSLSNCIGDLKAKFLLIDDGCPEQWKNKIIKSIGRFEHEYIYTNSIGNHKTFALQVDLLSSQIDSDYVYFAEDDYIYSNHGFAEGIELLQTGKADFISLFDHRGHYTQYHHSIKSSYIINDNNMRVRKTIPSTCMTFMTSKKTLIETKKHFLQYCSGLRDYPLRLALTKYNILRWLDIDWKYTDIIFKNIRVPASRLHLAMLRIRCRKQILFHKRYKLYCPIPSIATHLEYEDIAPLETRKDYSKDKK